MRKILRVLISRYSLCALLLLSEIALLTYIALYAYRYSLIFVILASIVSASVILSLINRDSNPEFKLTWLAIVMLVPVLGGVIYLVLASRKLTRRETRAYRDTVRRLSESKASEESKKASHEALCDMAAVSASAAGRAYAIFSEDESSEIYSSGEVRYFDSGEKMFSAMLDSVRRAKKYIFLEYFIVEEGEMWSALHDALLERIREGVEVRMLYDDIGCMKTLPRHYDRKLRSEGIECYRFAKITPRFSLSHNNRDHRKICVIDGECAFTGGINIADEYINKKRRFGHWKDGGVLVRGDAAIGFARMFLILFDLSSGAVSDPDEYLSPKGGSAGDGGFLIPFGTGPAPVYPDPVGKNALMNLISASTKYLYITTPYLIIDYDLTEALCSAARRGVDVRIITPAVADKKIVKIMTKSAYPYLIARGVRIFEYTPGFIHEKLVISDDTYAIVGTINFDYRSLVHHFEDALFIFGSPVIPGIRDSFLLTESVSREILPESAKLGFTERIIRNLVRIIAPLL